MSDAERWGITVPYPGTDVVWVRQETDRLWYIGVSAADASSWPKRYEAEAAKNAAPFLTRHNGRVKKIP